MDPQPLPLFSEEALAVLDSMPFDSQARCSFDMMTGGLIWNDEFPKFDSPEWEYIEKDWVFRFLLAVRADLTLDEHRSELRPVWEQVSQFAPNWPGLREERRGERAAKRLRIALRRFDKCLEGMESDPVFEDLR